MTTLEFFKEFVSPVCHKVNHNLEEFTALKHNENVVLVKATTFYQIYKHNVFGVDGRRLTIQEFFHICGQYLYYDKYICTHGTEFYYYVIFNEGNETYQLTKDLLSKRIWSNRPELLSDLLHRVEAVSKE